ncbi:MAG: flagellar biosynthetic protein FliO [Spirochaetaceae bacterium]|nr:flagellar biosynthetic protein FliO [Spirochaetaceae bacterium]
MLLLGILTFVVIPLSAQEETESTDNQEQIVDETTLVINNGETTVEGEPEVSVSAIGISDLVRTLLVLLLVIGAIYAVLYVLKKFSASPVDSSSLIKVVGSRGLMKDSAVHLLEVGNQVFLVGTGNSSVNLISEITDQETIDNIRLNLSSGVPEKTGTFAKRIAGYLGGGRKKNTEEKIKETQSFLRGQRSRLKDL